MTRKLVSICAIFAIAATANLAEAQTQQLVPNKKKLVHHHSKYLVKYWSPLRKRCFRGPLAKKRAYVLMKFIKAIGGKAKIKCYVLKRNPPIRVCCVIYKVPRRTKVFRSLAAAQAFRARLKKMGVLSILKKIKWPPVIGPPVFKAAS